MFNSDTFKQIAKQDSQNGFLSPNDGVAIQKFWINSRAMVAAKCFFLMKSQSVSFHWKRSKTVNALVTLVAKVHYFYKRKFWVL